MENTDILTGDRTVEFYLEHTIVEICSGKEGKQIHYLGYGYCSEDDENGEPYRFLEYTWFIAPLEKALAKGIYNFESENQDQYKQYIEDCTEERCMKIYETYDDGKMPKFIEEKDVNIDIEDGVYIIF